MPDLTLNNCEVFIRYQLNNSDEWNMTSYFIDKSPKVRVIDSALKLLYEEYPNITNWAISHVRYKMRRK